MAALASFRVNVRMTDDGSLLAELTALPIFLSHILKEQLKDAKYDEYNSRMTCSEEMNFTLRRDDECQFMGRMPKFKLIDVMGLHYLKAQQQGQRLSKSNQDLIKVTIIVKEAHQRTFSLHLGSIKMYRDLRSLYWWPRMKKKIPKYVLGCLTCQQVKEEHQIPSGKLYPLEISRWKWDKITMDFVLGFPLSPTKKNSVWMIVDRLTKSAHFLPVRTNYSLEKLAKLYISKIVEFTPFPASTYRHPSCQTEIQGTKIQFSIAFHPQIDGQSEKVIQVLEDMFRNYMINFGLNWEKYLHLVEFAYNNSQTVAIPT
ncbi:Gag protease polyprotein [Gossypium australe]|uniref:Gag protease polyprotein n=1 Tax=Gossypium australe TaxID=47621 RepID=A0A5B6VZ96_9ROSI|nr:Gag protease polyprotein [Gossypium australe]